MSSNEVFKRLPLDIEPINYIITLKPNLNEFIFDGEIEIEIEIKNETDKILLNSVELKFDKASLKIDDRNIESDKIDFDEKTEVASILFNEKLRIGFGVLSIKYTGLLNDNLKGFYRSKYQLPNGEQKYAAVTQFEAVDARRALPCWDEPARKATFDVRIIAEGDKTVISNMPIIETQDIDSVFKKFIFDRTPKMSTYLLAFIVGEFDYIEDIDKNGIKVRVYTPVGKREFGQYALDISLKTLPFYTNYFSIGYPLTKLDLIAIGEMGPGAMENWGLITYREDALLLDPKNSSLETKRRIAIFVGHELAHQWFGNLVTMEWWTDLWLNEGFASWIEYLCVDHCAPEFDIWTNFVISDWCSALELDSLKNSHPIEVPVNAPSEIDEIFDSISYSKGATVIRMLHDYIGDEAYRNGLHAYLDKYKYSNAITDNLWQYLGEASKKPVYELMQLWTKQTGYPVVTVSKSKNSKNEIILKLNQRRFFVNGNIPDESENHLWKIPIKIVTKSSYPNICKEFLFEKRDDEINLGIIEDNDWIKLNKNSVGIYRTHYSKDMLDCLNEPVLNKSFHATDRIGLQDDIFNLSQAGLVSTADALQFLESYIDEDEVAVWKGLLGNLGVLYGLLLKTDFYEKFSSFVKKLLKKISKKLGFDPIEGENSLQSMCRATVLKVLAKVGDEDTIKEAKIRFENHLNGQKLIPADLRTAIYIAVLYDADDKLLQKFIDLHDSSDFQEEKLRIACALGSVKDKNLIEKVLKFAISPSVRSQDSVTVIECVACSITNPYAQDITWSFVKDNWPFLSARYLTGFMIMDLVKSTTEGFASTEKYNDVKEFFEKNPTPGANRVIQQSLENILKNEAWLKKDVEDLRKFLSSY